MHHKITKIFTIMFVLAGFFAFSQEQKLPIRSIGEIEPIGQLKDDVLQVLLELQVHRNHQWKSLVRK